MLAIRGNLSKRVSTAELIARHRTLACKGFEVRSDAVSSERPKRGTWALGTAIRK